MTPKAFREKNGKSLRQMALLVGVTKQYIHLLENGHRSPSGRVARAYEVVSNGRVRLKDFPAIGDAA